MSKYRITIADDDEDDYITISDAFGELKSSTQLHRLTDGQQLLSYLASCTTEELPHLILLDLNMPKMDGMETIIFLKANPQWKEIPVIIYSTCNNSDQIKKCFRLGANGFVTKGNSYRAVVEFAEAVIGFLSGVRAIPGRDGKTILRA
jgi:CheY-like chemotaxis protein